MPALPRNGLGYRLSTDEKMAWNPSEPLAIAPSEYEAQVVAWLEVAGGNLEGFEISHQISVEGKSGEYNLDGFAEFHILGGATISVLVECKRHRRPVGRDVVLGVKAKLQEVRAHKAMVFSTSGFQRGAIEFASENGIALIMFVDGRLTYCVRSAEGPNPMRCPPGIPKYSYQIISKSEKGFSINSVEKASSLLADWFGVDVSISEQSVMIGDDQ